MRKRIRLVALVCLIVALASCDSDQPQQPPGSLAQVRFVTTAAAPVFDVWERYVDANQDGVPDQFDSQGFPIDPPIQVQCRQRLNFDGTQVTPVVSSVTSAPWTHSLEILILRAGETQAERLTSSDALGDEFNLTPYDDSRAPSQSPPPCTAPEVCTSLGTLTAAHRIVMESGYEDLARTQVLTSGAASVTVSGVYRCPGSGLLGEPRLGGTSAQPGRPPFTVPLEPGDTIIVRARKGEFPLGGLELASQPVLAGSLTIDGRPVTPVGTIETSRESGSGLSFSYTYR